MILFPAIVHVHFSMILFALRLSLNLLPFLHRKRAASLASLFFDVLRKPRIFMNAGYSGFRDRLNLDCGSDTVESLPGPERRSGCFQGDRRGP